VCDDGTTVSCRACGLRLRRTPEGFLTAGEVGAVSYPTTGADEMAEVEAASFWFAHRNAVIAMVLDRFPATGPLWDVGGGNGFQALMMQRSGRPVVLLEPNPAGCRHAVDRGVATVVNATLESLRLAGGTLGAASFFDVIEHLPDPVALLAEARRVLRPDGRVYLTVPAYRALWSETDDHAGHFRRYTRGMLAGQLVAAGLRPLYLSYFFRPLVWPIALARALPYRLPGHRMVDAAGRAHHGGGGTATRAMEWLLARERRRLGTARVQRFGASIVAVATS
jgi:SAM-dependent methyltransferase